METVFGLLGGLAVFLFGMNMMSEGLQKAAGAKMKSILSMLTSNPVLGVLEGTFELAGESILSRYVSRDRVYSGCEVLTLQADGSYHNAGVSMKNGRRMSAWTAVLSEERGRT